MDFSGCQGFIRLIIQIPDKNLLFNTIRIIIVVRIVLFSRTMDQAVKPKTTLLDHAILGLISGQAMSGYAIRKVFETTAMGNYSSSPGTIYPALRRLQKMGLADKLVANEDGKSKYSITKKGKQVFRSWLTAPLMPKDISRKLDEILLRFAFMDGLSNKQKLLFLGSMRDFIGLLYFRTTEISRS